MPGHGYAVVNGTPVGEVCTLGTYNSGDNKLSCKMCPSGLTTADKGSTDASQCGECCLQDSASRLATVVSHSARMPVCV